MKKSVTAMLDKILVEIKKERIKQRLSLEQVATKLDISPATYLKIERKDTKLTMERFLQIRDALDLSISNLFDLKSETTFNQEFNDNSIFEQKIQNLYQDNKEIYEKFSEGSKAHIKHLEEEIQFLRGNK